MPSVSNIAVGVQHGRQKARHQMNESIARLSTGIRSMYGDPWSVNCKFIRGKGQFCRRTRNAEDGISFLQSTESLLLKWS